MISRVACAIRRYVLQRIFLIVMPIAVIVIPVWIYLQDEVATYPSTTDYYIRFQTSEMANDTFETPTKENATLVQIPYESNGETISSTTTGSENSVDSISSTTDQSEIKTTDAYLTEAAATSTTEGDYSSYEIPLKIILPFEHVHKSSDDRTFSRYNYILLKVDDQSYHEHIFSDNSDILSPINAEKRVEQPVPDETTNVYGELTSMDTGSTVDNTDPVPTIDSSNCPILVDSEGYQYELDKHYKINDDSNNAVIEFDDIKLAHKKFKDDISVDNNIAGNIPDQTDDQEFRSMSSDILSAHYQKLYKWLNW